MTNTSTTALFTSLLNGVRRHNSAIGCLLYEDEVLAALTAALDGVDERAGEFVQWVEDTKENDRQPLDEAADLITALLAQNAALRAERDELERQVPRFPDHMAKIVEAKNAGLPERLQALVAALEAIPDHMRQYQWVADQKQAFGSKWVRAICGDNGKGMGRQAIAEVEGHIDVADFIAAANPDTVALMLTHIATLQAERDDAYAKGFSDAENEISATAIGQQNVFLHNQLTRAKAEVEKLRGALLFLKENYDCGDVVDAALTMEESKS